LGAALIAIALLLRPHILVAQEATAFREVSITRVAPAATPAPSSLSVLPGGRFEARNQTIENMVRVAFGFEQIDPAVGVVVESKFSAPQADRFNIDAVADRPWTTASAGQKVPSDFRVLLRRLLVDRFKLQARVELTNVDVLALQLARHDRERGPGLRRWNYNCLGPDDYPRDGDVRAKCGFRIERNRIEAGGVTMSELAALINDAADMRMERFVVDQTGLSGRYDVTLTLDKPAEGRRDAFRDALRTQLGLKLVKATVPLPTLIIDHAEAPAAN
jgi:uncharacterized protein (TIGR03435 family)